jgi:hypothetical protein
MSLKNKFKEDYPSLKTQIGTISNVFHVFKLIPYKKKNLRSHSSGSSSSSSKSSKSSNSKFSDFSSQSLNSLSPESSNDSEKKHISTPSDTSSASSREKLEELSQLENLNQEKMRKKQAFPKKPLYLDDSEIGQGKNMHIIQLQSYRMSMLPYVSQEQRKPELNRQFRNNFPKIRKAITFSKIRRLKKNMVKIFLIESRSYKDFNPEEIDSNEVKLLESVNELESDGSQSDNNHNTYSYMEVYTLSVAWILFETLILKNLVRKHNRRAYLATCILICFKQI